jgi:hypothetical protein
MLSALKKTSIHSVKWHFSAQFTLALYVSQLPCTAELPCMAQQPTFSADTSQASSHDAHALKKIAYNLKLNKFQVKAITIKVTLMKHEDFQKSFLPTESFYCLCNHKGLTTR